MSKGDTCHLDKLCLSICPQTLFCTIFECLEINIPNLSIELQNNSWWCGGRSPFGVQLDQTEQCKINGKKHNRRNCPYSNTLCVCESRNVLAN